MTTQPRKKPTASEEPEGTAPASPPDDLRTAPPPAAPPLQAEEQAVVDFWVQWDHGSDPDVEKSGGRLAARRGKLYYDPPGSKAAVAENGRATNDRRTVIGVPRDPSAPGAAIRRTAFRVQGLPEDVQAAVLAAADGVDAETRQLN